MKKLFATTGYRERDGLPGLFSVWVEPLDVPNAEGVQMARLFALVEEMTSRLPEVGECFILTAGPRIVAKAMTISRG